ncbi:bifunctional alpha,alpha-trehalose-phosphate synthase (UDP-forming)/trehalose-phosphatase [Sphingobacterium daejeonense]|uniref:bifunctional alpha,alpha-trehalose-phosphate synthase (UDP-forming)/trehalose-phosphatase n=1 Tax=Sphingobacterium daejeonense TaxID=371142 RepID=UPI0010C43093|nr:bifunctional alpha,alpha-trehalose-phosphate synthase (UDP-forming)/trehalose-phosphatase [Sphingobacterium daejeonense]VTP98191.1 Trehalose-phosphate synthase [Sphingobacterium daejeonense]
MLQNLDIPATGTLIISNRLPVKIERKKSKLKFTASEGGLATGLGSFYKENGSWWIGWPGIIPKNESEEKLIREELKKLNLIPVFLTEAEIKGYYEGFSNAILWPLCHYRPSYVELKQDYWISYTEANRKFAEAAIPFIEENTHVWVHDYQLMLVPNYIREQKESCSIGYFHHIPFPPIELFKMLPWREELLMGLMGSDLIGFHTYENVDNFLDSSSGILNLPTNINQLKINGRKVLVDVFPMGIDYEKYKNQAVTPETRNYATHLKSLYKDQKIILSVDRLDYSKGILQRLTSFEIMLNNHSELIGKIVLYMLIVPSRDQVGQYKKLRNEIDRKVGNINAVHGKPGWQPIAYFYDSLPFDVLSALYSAADVCWITSLYDGMNLVSKEFIASKQDSTGVLVISEFAGASKELSDALIINPYAVQRTSRTLYEAITMPVEEQDERLKSSQEIVSKFTVHHWVNLFMQRLSEVKNTQRDELARKVREKVEAEIKSSYAKSSNRLILLDYDGTLVGFNKNADKATPTQQVYDVLDQLSRDPKNHISIISGRKYSNLDKWFSERPYYLIAEHGIWSNFPNKEWHLVPGLSNTWKADIHEILQRFTDRTPGSSIEEKSYSLAWHYRKVEKAFGIRQAQELLQELRHLNQVLDLQIINGDRVIEIKSKLINKGKAAINIVDQIKPDFILCIGDDATDEDMFISLPDTSITIKVGDKQSHAKYYVENHEEVLRLLDSLSK